MICIIVNSVYVSFPPVFTFENRTTKTARELGSQRLGVLSETIFQGTPMLKSLVTNRAFEVLCRQVTFSVSTPACIPFKFRRAHVTLVGPVITVHLDNVPFHIARFTKQFVTLRAGDVLGFQMLPSMVTISITS